MAYQLALASNLVAMASNLLAMASKVLAMASNPIANLLAMASKVLAMASNLLAMASNLPAMASNLLAMASNLRAMACNQRRNLDVYTLRVALIFCFRSRVSSSSSDWSASASWLILPSAVRDNIKQSFVFVLCCSCPPAWHAPVNGLGPLAVHLTPRCGTPPPPVAKQRLSANKCIATSNNTITTS